MDLKRTPILAAMLILCALPAHLFGQDAEQVPLQGVLEPVEVEATHSSITIDRASMSVTTSYRSMEEMVARPAATLNELTFTLPGVWISNRGNQALGERMTIRGMGWRSQFGVRGVQIILDDIPLTVADGQSVLNMVDPAMVQSIELLRGPSAIFWGNSSGGVLYMRTRPPADSPNFMFRGYGGSYNTMKYEGRWHDQINGVRLNGYGSYYKSDGYRDYSASRLIRSGISAGFEPWRNGSITTQIAYSGMPSAEHPGSLNKTDAENNPSMAWPFNVNTRSGKEFHQLMGSGTYVHDFDSGILNFSGHGVWRDLRNPLPGPYITVDRLAGGTRASYSLNNIPFDLQFGGELRWQRDERGQTNNDGGEPGSNRIISQLDRVGTQALFIQTAFDVGSFTLTGGLRGDRMAFQSDSIDVNTGDIIPYPDEERIFTTLNPSAGITYHLRDARLYTNISTSFESPTTTEFKNRLGGDGSIQPGFNPNLDPERTLGVEAGLRGVQHDLNLEYDLAVYGQFVSDQIIQETEIDGQAIFANGGDAEHYGLEAHLRMRPARSLSLELMYSWIDARFSGGEFESDVKDNRLPGVAPHRIGSTLGLTLGDHRVSSDLEWVSSYYADSDNTVKNDAYMLVSGRWLYSGIGSEEWSLQPFVSVNNIFDARYNTSVAINNAFGRFFEPGAGRNVQMGISLQF